MSHESDLELSALIDGELPADELEQANAHVASCPQCSERLNQLRQASAAFKRSGEAPLPAGFKKKIVLKGTVRVPVSGLRIAVGLVVALLLILAVAGIGMKTFMPGLYSQIQGMISGAAGSLGSGGG